MAVTCSKYSINRCCIRICICLDIGTLTEVGIDNPIATGSTKIYEGYYYVKGEKPLENFNRIVNDDTMKACYAKRRKSNNGTATLDDDVYIIKFIVLATYYAGWKILGHNSSYIFPFFSVVSRCSTNNLLKLPDKVFSVIVTT